MCGKQSSQFITLEIRKVERKFSSLWLKRVDDVNLNKHCIECLVGSRFPIQQERGATASLPAPGIYYLCGVTYPYVWENNFHLAFEYEEGGRFIVGSKGLVVAIKNARVLPITPDYIDRNLPQALDPKFNTCRNWQFANYFAKKCEKMQQTLF